MLKKDIIPTLIFLSRNEKLFEGASVIYYFKGISHTFVDVRLKNDTIVEVIFNALNQISCSSMHWNTTPPPEITPPPEKETEKPSHGGTPCTAGTKTVCICELPF